MYKEILFGISMIFSVYTLSLQAAETDKACSGVFTTQSSHLLAVLPTDAGMHGLWTPSAFSKICDEETWGAEFIEKTSIEKHIKSGHFIPLYVHSDGAPSIEVRVYKDSTQALLKKADRQWVKAESADYLIVSEGVINVSGIEYIGGPPTESVRSLQVPAGRWVAKVFYLESPDSARSEDELSPPDFLVILRPESAEPVAYRQSVETFADSSLDIN